MNQLNSSNKLERLSTYASLKFKLAANRCKVIRLRQCRFSHESIAVGGTFDLIHRGHERLLGKAFELGELVFVGVSGDSLVGRLHKNHPVRSFADRSRALKKFLGTRGWLSRARVSELKDPFGPAIRRRALEALVVSSETKSSGDKVNTIRRSRGLRPLRLYVVRMVRAEDNKPISVTRIRLGEIDSSGKRKKNLSDK